MDVNGFTCCAEAVCACVDLATQDILRKHLMSVLRAHDQDMQRCWGKGGWSSISGYQGHTRRFTEHLGLMLSNTSPMMTQALKQHEGMEQL